MRFYSIYFVVLWCTVCVIGCSESPSSVSEDSEESPFTSEKMKFFDQALSIGNLIIRQEDFGRGALGEPLYYEPNQEAPYTGWVKNEKFLHSKKIEEGELFHVMNGKKHGLYIRWNFNNRKIEKGSYENGLKHGLWTYWYRWRGNDSENDSENDAKDSEGWYKNGLRHGLWTDWDIPVPYKDDVYHTKKGSYREGSYKNGWKDGLWIHWYGKGQKAIEGTYREPPQGFISRRHTGGMQDSEEFSGEHIRVGVWTFWYENGQKSAQGEYRDIGGQINLKTGLWTFWYENGQKSAQGEYDGDYTDSFSFVILARQVESFDSYETPETARVGVWTTWYENGQKKSQGEYEGLSPSKTGLWTYWYKNGQKESQGEYKNDQKVGGTWTYWGVNGQIWLRW